MRRVTPLITLAIAVGLSAPAAFARPGGGNGAAMSAGPSAAAGSHALANTNGPSSPDRDFGRDRAEDRMSAQGAANSNSPSSADRDLGRDRAEDRMSAQAKAKARAKGKTKTKQ